MISVLVPIIYGALRWAYLPSFLRLVVLYLFTAMLFDILVVYKGYYLSEPNRDVMHVYTVVEAIIWIRVYHVFFPKRIPTQLSYILSGLVIGWAVVNTYLTGDIYNFSYTQAVTNTLIILLSLLYFKQTFDEFKPVPIHKEPMFWVNSSVLFYYGSTFFLFVMTDFVLHNDAQIMVLASYLWGINSVARLIIHGLFCIAFHLAYKKIASRELHF